MNIKKIDFIYTLKLLIKKWLQTINSTNQVTRS